MKCQHIQPRGVSDLASVKRYMEFEAEWRRKMLAAFNLPAYLVGGVSPDPIAPSFDFQPEIVRQSPAVRMASRALPNPNGEPQ